MDHHLRHAGDGDLEQTKLHTSDPVLADIVRRLVDADQLERIYLFGSRA
jgi:hypothetical protein